VVWTRDFDVGRGAMETAFEVNCYFAKKSAGPGAWLSNFLRLEVVSF